MNSQSFGKAVREYIHSSEVSLSQTISGQNFIRYVGRDAGKNVNSNYVKQLIKKHDKEKLGGYRK